jgi:hypothetical protein
MRQRLWISIAYLLLLAMVCGFTVPAGAATTVTVDFEELRVDNADINFVGTVSSQRRLGAFLCGDPVDKFHGLNKLIPPH